MRATIQKVALADSFICELHPLPRFISWNSCLIINMKKTFKMLSKVNCGKFLFRLIMQIKILHEPQNCLKNYKGIKSQNIHFSFTAENRSKYSIYCHMHHLLRMVLTTRMPVARHLCKMTVESAKDPDHKEFSSAWRRVWRYQNLCSLNTMNKTDQHLGI